MNPEQTLTIRVATLQDAQALLALYAPYVTDTAITFEYEVPSLKEFRQRIMRTLESHPYLVAERGDCILGYAYTGVFKARAAYDRCVETTIYVRRDSRNTGVGKKLYAELERISVQRGILNLYACIAWPASEDPYLTRDSVNFHRHLGYETVGRFRNCGFKFGRWYDMVWMEKMIGEHSTSPSPVIPFPLL